MIVSGKRSPATLKRRSCRGSDRGARHEAQHGFARQRAPHLDASSRRVEDKARRRFLRRSVTVKS